MNRTRAADRKPTWTSLCMSALQEADDFVTSPQLQTITGASSTQTSAALIHLRKCGVVDCMESEGHLWWFVTNGPDKRTHTVDHRRPEEPGTRRRGSRKFLSLVTSGAPHETT